MKIKTKYISFYNLAPDQEFSKGFAQHKQKILFCEFKRFLYNTIKK